MIKNRKLTITYDKMFYVEYLNDQRIKNVKISKLLVIIRCLIFDWIKNKDGKFWPVNGRP